MKKKQKTLEGVSIFKKVPAPLVQQVQSTRIKVPTPLVQLEQSNPINDPFQTQKFGVLPG
jgi:hypothetical protein